jgi:death on curing protein
MSVPSLSLQQVLELHEEAIRRYGGSVGVRDLGLVDSALAQPDASFGGVEFYPTLVEKIAALGFSLVRNHGFIDGNKRVGYAAMDVFARGNGHRLAATTDDAEAATLAVAASQWTLAQLTEWVRTHLQPLPT